MVNHVSIVLPTSTSGESLRWAHCRSASKQSQARGITFLRRPRESSHPESSVLTPFDQPYNPWTRPKRNTNSRWRTLDRFNVFGVDFTRDPSIPVLLQGQRLKSLRIFNRNQGEEARTKLDITRRRYWPMVSELCRDVDFAYARSRQNSALLRPYNTQVPGTGCAPARDVRLRIAAPRSLCCCIYGMR